MRLDILAQICLDRLFLKWYSLVSVPQWDSPCVHGDRSLSLYYMCQFNYAFVQILW